MYRAALLPGPQPGFLRGQSQPGQPQRGLMGTVQSGQPDWRRQPTLTSAAVCRSRKPAAPCAVGPTGATPTCLSLRHKFPALYHMASYENTSHGYGFWIHSFTTNVFLYQPQIDSQIFSGRAYGSLFPYFKWLIQHRLQCVANPCISILTASPSDKRPQCKS